MCQCTSFTNLSFMFYPLCTHFSSLCYKIQPNITSAQASDSVCSKYTLFRIFFQFSIYTNYLTVFSDFFGNIYNLCSSAVFGGPMYIYFNPNSLSVFSAVFIIISSAVIPFISARAAAVYIRLPLKFLCPLLGTGAI